MVVSHRHRFVFFAVPRTGTHAIRAALQPVLGDEDWQQVALGGGARLPVPELARLGHGHISLRQVQSSVAEDVWRGYFKFAVVRNPYDRFVSVCAMLNKRNPGYAGGERAFMKRALAVRRFQQRVLVRPQTELLTDRTGRVGMDFVGRFETLQESFDAACRQIGIRPAPLAATNATEHAASDTYYDEELRRVVTDFYRRDFEMFGYQPASQCA